MPIYLQEHRGLLFLYNFRENEDLPLYIQRNVAKVRYDNMKPDGKYLLSLSVQVCSR